MSMLLYVLLAVCVVAAAVVAYQVVIRTTYWPWTQTQGQRERFEEEKNDQDAPHTKIQWKLVYLHMNGCSYCRKFDPTWEKLVSQYGSELRQKGVQVKSYESNDREALGFSVAGYPTVLLVSAQSDEVAATFNDERTVSNLLRFVDKQIE
jgi:thiol-disulfide isomerase/thioredoxin